MTDVRGLLIKLLEGYTPEKVGFPPGEKCSWCGVLVQQCGAFDDPEQHDESCLYRAVLEWRIRAENQ